MRSNRVKVSARWVLGARARRRASQGQSRPRVSTLTPLERAQRRLNVQLEFNKARGGRIERRRPRAHRRLRALICLEHGVDNTARQWRKLLKRLRREDQARG